MRMVEDFYRKLIAEGASRNTVYQAKKVLSAALTHAMRQELLLRNVARLAEMPQYKPKEAQYWTAQETIAFLSAAKSGPLYHALALTVYCTAFAEARCSAFGGVMSILRKVCYASDNRYNELEGRFAR
ncbi:hypothetical protein [Streptomyces sp. NPDC059631]|uniref:hypothetical protein n=1 Tax=unclassified Streptomyces TaxID=2593676 RepID=UPI00368E3CE5